VKLSNRCLGISQGFEHKSRIYPVIWKILGVFSSQISREIDHPWRPLSLPQYHSLWTLHRKAIHCGGQLNQRRGYQLTNPISQPRNSAPQLTGWFHPPNPNHGISKLFSTGGRPHPQHPQQVQWSLGHLGILRVGGFNQTEKYESKWVFLPNFRDEHEKYLSCHHLV